MSDNTPPTQPKPKQDTLRVLAPAPSRRPSTWALIAAVATAAPSLVNLWTPILTPKQAAALTAIAATLAALAGVLAQVGATDSAGRVAELPGNGGGVVPPQE